MPVLATCYAAKIADVSEASKYTSVKQRVDHIKAEDRTAQLEAAKAGSVAGSLAASGLEEDLWLCPIEDRHRLGSSREGMFEGLSIGSYLLLVDYTGRLFREGKARISAKLAGILDRIGSGAGELAAPDGKAQERTMVRSLLRGQRRKVPRNSQSP